MINPFIMKKLLFIALLASVAVSTASAQESLRKKHFSTENGVAISGYDPVTYFTQNKAVKGKKDIAYVYQGITYYFANAQDKETFAANPTKYEPQYGGWCAYAMGATGEKVEVDPATFKIVDNKLYLFYNKFFNNTLKTWNKDETNLKPKADASWAKTFH